MLACVSNILGRTERRSWGSQAIDDLNKWVGVGSLAGLVRDLNEGGLAILQS